MFEILTLLSEKYRAESLVSRLPSVHLCHPMAGLKGSPGTSPPGCDNDSSSMAQSTGPRLHIQTSFSFLCPSHL